MLQVRREETYKELLNKVLSLLVESFREVILQFLDFLPSHIVGGTLESKATSNHLVQYAS